MPDIQVDQQTFEKLAVTAQLTDRTVGSVVKMLVDKLTANAAGSAERLPVTRNTDEQWIPVYKVFKGHRVEGRFNPSTMEVQVASAPWSGQVFASPTAAAQSVVEHFSGDRETSNTNGRRFWKVTPTDKDLRSIVGER